MAGAAARHRAIAPSAPEPAIAGTRSRPSASWLTSLAMGPRIFRRSLVAAGTILSLVVAPAVHAGPHPLVTAVVDPAAFSGPESQLALQRVHDAGASVVRISIDWASIAPLERPLKWNPGDPAAPGYKWNDLDSQVIGAKAAGLEPLVSIYGVPGWARVDRIKYHRPILGELNAFALAAATRYGGKTPDLPRVRYWQVWNEPNLNTYLTPQFNGKTPVSPKFYRAMVNNFASAIHQVHADNLVVAGGLSPFTVKNKYFESVAPLDFMRRMLCMSKGSKPHPVCKTAVHFDVWSHHPYTSGGPTHHAMLPDDVSLGDLPEMKELLSAAARSGQIVSRRPVRFWVTEFGWDTNPPDKGALPVRLQARWTSEALYRMWLVGVSLVTWFEIRDGHQPPQGDFQTGLWYRGQGGLATDRPKPTLTAFRFPFVAYARNGRISCWGRTPWGKTGAVNLEVSADGGWTRLARVQADRFGVFRISAPSTVTKGYVRARSADGSSLPFSLTEPPDRTVPPFGST
jgi:hypothetical protein